MSFKEIAEFDNYTSSLNVIDGTANTARQNALIKDTAYSYAIQKQMSTIADGQGLNYAITASVGSNNLTVTLKGGNSDNLSFDNFSADPFTIGNTAYFRINDGVYTSDTIFSLSANAVLTLNAGTNWFDASSTELDNKEIQLFVYICVSTWATSPTPYIGLSRLPYLRKISDGSTTNTDYNYIATSYTPNATDQVRVIGRINVKLNSNNWQSLSSYNIINAPIFETDFLDYLPTFCSGQTITFSGGGSTCKYKVKYNTCFIQSFIVGTVTGTANKFNHTVPVKKKTTSPAVLSTSWTAVSGNTYNDASSQTNLSSFFYNGLSGVVTGNIGVIVTGEYEI